MTHSEKVRHPVTLDVVCQGDAWEMGLAQGTALGKKIRKALEVFTELEAVQLAKARWMPLSVFRRLAEFKAKKILTRGLTETLPTANARLRGIAKGARLTPRSICLLNAMEPVMSDLTQVAVVPVAAACSAVAVTKTSSADGQPIVAHNFDYLPMVRPLYTLRECRPQGRLRSLEFMAAPMCGAVDGINEAGLCITYNYAHTTDGKRPAPTLSMWIAEALATCRTVVEAAELLTRATRWGGGLLMLADAEGNIASLELSSTKAELRWPRSGEDRIFHSNRFHTKTMRPVEVAEEAVFSCRAPQALRDRRIHQSADVRDCQFF